MQVLILVSVIAMSGFLLGYICASVYSRAVTAYRNRKRRAIGAALAMFLKGRKG